VSAREATRRPAAAIAVELAIDDPELAERVRAMIMRQPGLRLVDTEGPAAPDIRIADAMAEDAADVPVIVFAEGGRAWDALLGGAAAVLADSSDGATLYAAIHAVAQGLTLLSEGFRRELLIDRAANDELAEADPDPVAVELSARERQVLRLLAEGASNKVIARRLGITPHTAKFHVASIVTKLGAIGRTDAVARAMRLGLVMI
jgi:DNA-binding NarL/FixJ family response regulator